MELVQIVFSPTGGTGKVADIITEEWDGTVTRIDLTNAETDFSKITIGQEDIVLAAVLTKRQGERVWFPKLQKTVWAAVYAQRTVRHRRSVGKT